MKEEKQKKGENEIMKRAGKAKELYEEDAKTEEEQMAELEKEIKERLDEKEIETEEITENIKGAFIKYDVEYTDTLNIQVQMDGD